MSACVDGRFFCLLLFACLTNAMAKIDDDFDFLDKLHDFPDAVMKQPIDGAHEPEIPTVLQYQVEKDIEEFIRKGFEKAEEILLQQSEAVIPRSGNARVKQFHSMTFPDIHVQHESNCRGLGLLETSRLIAKHFNISKDEAYEVLKSITIPESTCRSINKKCMTTGERLPRQLADFTVQPCNRLAKYRTTDGTCNNLNNPQLGAAGTIVGRFIRPQYGDGVNSPRTSVSGAPLPNPRIVSTAMANSRPPPTPSTVMTQMVKAWGQFLDHDITITPESVVLDRNGNPQSIACCENGQFPTTRVPADCLPIDVRGDPFYRSKGVSCLRFVRSLISGCQTCNLGARTQVNGITSFIDCSHLYGSRPADQRKLRKFRGGKMTTSQTVETGACPHQFSPCSLSFLLENPSDNIHEFIAGDSRVNEQPGLTCMHSIFMRYHNKLADALHIQNPQWNDETLFQESRKIMGAIMQHITYSEFLPIVLGATNMRNNGIVPINEGFFLGYNSSINPSITSGFATAAYRFGHSLISNNIKGANGILAPLSENFLNSNIIRQPVWFPSQTIQGESSLPSENLDVVLVDAVRNRLFAEGPAFDHGFDLMSLNIMRGRDHGIPSYNKWRTFCGLKRFGNFSQLINSGELEINAAREFARLYANVDDVDLFPGGLAENPSSSGILGPTFSCILGRQFHNLRFGDRFWYENGNLPNSFTGRQLSMIKMVSLASVICETTTATRIQKWPMLTRSDPRNAPLFCLNMTNSLFKPANIGAWKV